ncbi:unnamed protein product [Moneuplotes crassus]|uniref:Uncharacterized protein n=1 Tax=Euplotes crassus TaxID=5936 RepID=A0AAD2DAZ7_EUPCR|nr:unnamed protein product [Moneuplotes crassus]
MLSNTSYTPAKKDFLGLRVESSKLDCSDFSLNSHLPALQNGDEKIHHTSEVLGDPLIVKGMKEMITNYCTDVVSKLNDPDIIIINKNKYEEQRQEILQNFKAKQMKLIDRIKELEETISNSKNNDNPSQNEPYMKKTPSQSEVNFLLALKEKIKILHAALKKEKEDKAKLSVKLTKVQTGADSEQDSRSSFANSNSPFNFNEERARGYTMLHRSRGNSMIGTRKDQQNNSMRKSLDETSYRLEDKYGEKFWQNQVQRVIKQNQNYSMLYNTKKQLTEKENLEVKSENEKLKRLNRDLQSQIEKIKTELDLYKTQLLQQEDGKSPLKRKFTMRPKKVFHELNQKTKSDGKLMDRKKTILQPFQRAETIEEEDSSIPASRMTFSATSRGTIAKEVSETAVTTEESALKIAQPTEIFQNPFKTPLKSMDKKKAPERIDIKKPQTEPPKQTKAEPRYFTQKTLANAAKGDKVISIEDLNSEDTVTNRSEYSAENKEEFKDHNSDLRSESKSGKENHTCKGCNPLGGLSKNHTEVIQEEKEIKDTFGDKISRIFGFKKKSTQLKDFKSLSTSSFERNTNCKTKVSQSLADYAEIHSSQMGRNETPESFQRKPGSALEDRKTPSRGTSNIKNISENIDSDEEGSNQTPTNPIKSSFQLQLAASKEECQNLKAPKTARIQRQGNLTTYHEYDEELVFSIMQASNYFSAYQPKERQLDQSTHKETTPGPIQPEKKLSFFQGLQQTTIKSFLY